MIAPTLVCNIENGLSMGGNTMNQIWQDQSVSNSDNRLYRHQPWSMYVTMAGEEEAEAAEEEEEEEEEKLCYWKIS